MSNYSKRTRILSVCVAGFIALGLGGCASTQDQQAGEVYDPMEGMNRAVFDVNNAVDQAVLEPVAKGYRAVTPKLARDGVRNFLRNLKTPINVANQILQGDIEGAAGDLSRFAMNTTIGIGGLFDVAAETGLEYEPEDFGQTMAVWGVGHGPYLMLPILGPSSMRDSTGMLVDFLVDPVRLYLHNTDRNEWSYVRAGATAISTREEFLDVLDDLRKNSLDYYAAVRSAYMQRREALVNDEDPELSSGPSIPDYDNE